MNEEDLIDYEHEVLGDRLQAIHLFRRKQIEQQLRIEQLEAQIQVCQERNRYLEDQNYVLDYQIHEKLKEYERISQQEHQNKQIIDQQQQKILDLQQHLDKKHSDCKYLSTMVSTLQQDQARNKQHLLKKLNHSKTYVQNVRSICLSLNDCINEIFGNNIR